MWTEYRRQSKRLKLLPRYRFLVTPSEHMRREYLRHGFAEDRVHVIPYQTLDVSLSVLPDGTDVDNKLHLMRVKGRHTPLSRLLFMGRMTDLKGGHYFLRALPLIRAALDRPLTVTFVGDGPARAAWQNQAAAIQAQDPSVSISFPGWAQGPEVMRFIGENDLLVIPSTWPEPFGMVGLEAGLHGLPAAAFAVGGIPDWLEDGVNGHLAEGTVPNHERLAEAVVACLRDTDEYARLSRGAVEAAKRFSVRRHLDRLIPLFEAARSGA